MPPDVQFTQAGTVNIAYQVFGAGPVDLVLVPGWVSNLDTFWEEPSVVRFFDRLGSFSRVILFDKRGTGLSDRVTQSPTLEERMDDVRAVLDAVGSERAALLGYSEGGPMCALFSVTYPARTEALIMIGSFPTSKDAGDYSYGRTPEGWRQFTREVTENWGGPVGLESRAPSRSSDPRFRHWWAKFLRTGASPSTALALNEMNAEIDIRHLLPVIRVPTLLLHAIGDRTISVEASRFMAKRIPGAKLVEFDSDDHLPFTEPARVILDEIEEFLTGTKDSAIVDSRVSTVMFTDIVGSTERASELGDRQWRDLLESHHAAVRHALDVHRGREIKTTGDGFHATFDGPARAIRCGLSIQNAVKPLGLSLRVGLHTGELVLSGDDIEGVAVHIAARVAELASADQVLVSQTVKDLVAGSGIGFEDQGLHTFKGIEDQWRVFSVLRE
jgi:pimeloyl-ACP methyl ester carboxylesterase